MKSLFEKLIYESKETYKTWVPLYSPALKQEIVFNMRGFNHLRFEVNNKPRKSSEVIYKLKLLSFVRTVIKTAPLIDEYRKRISPLGGSHKKVLKEIEYWSLSKEIDEQNMVIKVILRKALDENKIYFWSVMGYKNKKSHRNGENL